MQSASTPSGLRRDTPLIDRELTEDARRNMLPFEQLSQDCARCLINRRTTGKAFGAGVSY